MNRVRICPVCGNAVVVNSFVGSFRCRYCRRMVKVNAIKRKGKWHIDLEEAMEEATRVDGVMPDVVDGAMVPTSVDGLPRNKPVKSTIGVMELQNQRTNNKKVGAI